MKIIEFFSNKDTLLVIMCLYLFCVCLLIRQFIGYLDTVSNELCYLCGDDRCKLSKSHYIPDKICTKCMKKEDFFTKRDFILLTLFTIAPPAILLTLSVLMVVFMILGFNTNFIFLIQLIMFFLLIIKKKILTSKYATTKCK